MVHDTINKYIISAVLTMYFMYSKHTVFMCYE